MFEVLQNQKFVKYMIYFMIYGEYIVEWQVIIELIIYRNIVFWIEVVEELFYNDIVMYVIM